MRDSLGNMGLILDESELRDTLYAEERARRLLQVGRDLLTFGRPWRPLVGAREYAVMRKSEGAMRTLRQAVSIYTGGPRLANVKPRRRPVPDAEKPPVRAELPSSLDPGDVQYARHVARLQYARNALLMAPSLVGDNDDVVVHNRIYRKTDLPLIVELLRPWYRAQFPGGK